MAQSICDCHCGTRIDLDEQLLEERETWKQKYLCLQKQFKIDIEAMKENIYAQCSELMVFLCLFSNNSFPQENLTTTPLSTRKMFKSKI